MLTRKPPSTGSSDPYNLHRFVEAQALVIESVRSELQRGRKQSHWMWFVFPQLKGLGHSQTADYFGISSREEARAYLEHPVLGSRLKECTRLVWLIEDKSIEEIFGYPDDLKFRSCMTLFAEVNPHIELFKDALQKYFEGAPDPLTLSQL